MDTSNGQFDTFPPNPTNGQLFEIGPGQLFQYSTFCRSWQRVIRPSLPLATPISDGLMSAADYLKLTNILLPPPRSTLTAPGCKTVTVGYVDFTGDNYISVDVKPDNITENTGLVEFGLDFNYLVQDLISLNRVRFITLPGDQGDTGPIGDPGMNALPVGPYGLDGQPGLNVPWPGVLIQDNLSVKADNRAIVDIQINRVSPTENYLVLKRANLGNPDACPDSIHPIDKQSPWLLCVSSAGVIANRVLTSDGKLVCSSACNSSLYYLNMEALVKSVRTQFTTYLNNQRAAKQIYTQQQLDIMSANFEEQKQAIGCALEKCRSKGRNAQARQYLETSKIAAATADSSKPGYKLAVAGLPPGVNAQSPTWGKAGVNYDPIVIQNPEEPLVDPDKLKKGPAK